MAGQSLGAVGLLSAIPWIVSAAVGVWGGSVSDFLAQKLNWCEKRGRRPPTAASPARHHRALRAGSSRSAEKKTEPY